MLHVSNSSAKSLRRDPTPAAHGAAALNSHALLMHSHVQRVTHSGTCLRTIQPGVVTRSHLDLMHNTHRKLCSLLGSDCLLHAVFICLSIMRALLVRVPTLAVGLATASKLELVDKSACDSLIDFASIKSSCVTMLELGAQHGRGPQDVVTSLAGVLNATVKMMRVGPPLATPRP